MGGPRRPIEVREMKKPKFKKRRIKIFGTFKRLSYIYV